MTGAIGRHGELERLDGLLGRLSDAGPRVVEVVGDPGIGKTRLLTEFAVRARRAGWVVLSGRAAEYERQVPFGIVTDALDQHVAAAGADRLSALRADELLLLREVFPALPATAGAAPPELVEVERYRLHRAIRGLLEALAAPAGLVLILDDLHWADDGSAELLDHLLRHPPRGRLLLVLAHRPRQTPGRLRQSLARAVQEGPAELIELGPLSTVQADELLPAEMPPRRRRELYEISGGNPFYLLALLRGGARHAGAPGAVPDPVGQPAGGVPAPVQAALAGELAALDATGLLVAHAAALLGDEVEPVLIAHTAALELPQVLSTLDDLAERDLIRPGRQPGRFQFRHPLVRRATYEQTKAGWRVAAHARAAAALRARGATATELAHHVEHSAGPGDLPAVDTLRDAASAAMYRTPATAAHWLEATLRLLPADGPVAKLRLPLLGMYARALAATGRLADSREVVHEVLAMVPTEMAAFRAEIVVTSAMIERLLGQHAPARAMLVRELARVPDQHGEAALWLKIGLANGSVMGHDVDPDTDWVAEALATARRRASPGPLAGALGMSFLVRCRSGLDLAPAVPLLDEARTMVDALADGELGRSLQGILWLSLGELYAERMEDAQRHLLRAVRVARSTGQSHLLGYMYGVLGVVHGLSGDLGAAHDCFANELEAALMTGSVTAQGLALQHQSWLALWSGDVGEAVRLGKEAVSAAHEGADLIAASAVGELAQAHLHGGDPAACAEMMVSAGGGVDLPAVEPLQRMAWLEALTAANMALGRAGEAADAAQQAERSAALVPLPRRLAYAQFARVHLLLPADPLAALACAQRALAALTGSGDRVNTGRAHLFAGLALADAGDPEGAREQFSRARALFEAAGAGLFRNQTIRAQRRMNARFARGSRQPAGRDGPAGVGLSPAALTPRERQVADLVAEGLTNRQIAERLFLSPKTVGVHLERVYAKLGVSRRAAVAAALRPDPQPPPPSRPTGPSRAPSPG